jgi:mannose-1-phosphate guanylyltransferase
VPIILCGGEGRRLHPLSNALRPKPFLPILEDISLLQQTWKRVSQLPDIQAPMLLGSAQFADEMHAQMQAVQVEDAWYLAEPVSKGTAAALVVAALQLCQQQSLSAEEPVMLILPTDHAIKNEEMFSQDLVKASLLARQDRCVMLGAPALSVDSEYGYIVSANQNIAGDFVISSFEEKPESMRVKALLHRSGVFWNTGIICIKPSQLLLEMKRYAPSVLRPCMSAFYQGEQREKVFYPEEASWATLLESSLEVTLCEKLQGAIMVPTLAGWSDIGTWDRLFLAACAKNSERAVIGRAIGEYRHITQDIRLHGKILYTLHAENEELVLERRAAKIF